MTHLRVSPQLHKALVSASRKPGAEQLITLAGYQAQPDPDVVVFQVSVAPSHSKGRLAAARFDPVMNSCALHY